jgi:hypothetical protein
VRHYTLTPDAVVASCGRATATSQPGSAATAAGGDARASERPSAAQAAALLSMGHISSPSRKLVVWREGSRADFPRCPNPRDLFNVEPPVPDNAAKRGAVTEFSAKSRRRLVRLLATMKRTQTAYTMALTMVYSDGDDVLALCRMVMESFKVMTRRLANVSQFASVSGVWKREYHKSGVVHYHLILFGLEDATLRAAFHEWMVRKWNDLLGPHLSKEKQENHRWWHARSQNMEAVKNFSYFAKYVGVPEESGALTGRWWGCFNKSELPVAAKAELDLPKKAVAMLDRLVRRRQQGRANEAKHRKTCDRFGLLDSVKRPIFSLFRLSVAASYSDHRRGELLERSSLARMSYLLQEFAKSKGARWGKAKVWKSSNAAGRVVCDPGAPEFALKALKYVSETLGLNLELEACLPATQSSPSSVTSRSALPPHQRPVA